MLIINVFIIRAGSDNVNSPPDILHSVQILIIFCPPALHSPVFGSHRIGSVHRHSQFSFPFRISIAHSRSICQLLSVLLLLLRPRFRKLPYRVGLPSFAVLIPFPNFNCSYTLYRSNAFRPSAPAPVFGSHRIGSVHRHLQPQLIYNSHSCLRFAVFWLSRF